MLRTLRNSTAARYLGINETNIVPLDINQETEVNGTFTEQDNEQLKGQGVTLSEAQRQLALLRESPVRVELDRAAVVGDGIVRLEAGEVDLLRDLHRAAAKKGRWMKFTPASGAASRMFRLSTEDAQETFCENIKLFGFADQLVDAATEAKLDLEKAVAEKDFSVISELLLEETGLNYSVIAKGLVPFHRTESSARTAFEEHLHETAECFANRDNQCAVHFTVQQQHQTAFEELVDKIQENYADIHWSVGFSLQKPSTDTIGIDDQGNPLRREDGSLVLRPGGHGALIENLADLGGDCVFVKNIDNVRHPDRQQASHEWIETLCGYLLKTEQAVHDLVRQLEQNPNESQLTEIEASARSLFPAIGGELGNTADEKRDALLNALQRPIRICGMVANEGEPGGGPFWTRHPDGSVSLQVVEAVEINSNPSNEAIVKSATHFNPVLMALSLRDSNGNPFDLRQAVNAERAIITQKSVDGKMATVLEHPGLWNGAMAFWNTIFVEVPIEVFSPVKTVLDLLRTDHQPL